MASTSSLGPLSNASVAGKTNWGQPQRLHRTQTSSSAAFTVSSNIATLWYNCFDSNQIPAGATINGIELVSETINSGTGRIGTAGSTGPTESATMSIYLYNGSTYSTSLYSNTFTDSNDYYPDPYGSGEVLVGGPTNLVGLSWDPADQANFGFRIDVDSITATPVSVASRGLALKVYYTEVAKIYSFNDVSGNDIKSVNSVFYCYDGLGTPSIIDSIDTIEPECVAVSPTPTPTVTPSITPTPSSLNYVQVLIRNCANFTETGAVRASNSGSTSQGSTWYDSKKKVCWEIYALGGSGTAEVTFTSDDCSTCCINNHLIC
jgi:hypothetical protein